jgi:hypothetical protein
MPRYTVAHSYAAHRDGRTFGPWAPGEQVELDEADAAWVERDSPGVFAAPEPARQAEPKPNRQARGGRNRGA